MDEVRELLGREGISEEEIRREQGRGIDTYFRIQRQYGFKSFSPKNLHYMHKFYQMFASFSNYPQLVAKLDSASESEKFERNFDEICEKVPECIFQIPWGQHKYILDRCSGNPEKALFYIQQTRDMWFCPGLSLVFEFMRLAD